MLNKTNQQNFYEPFLGMAKTSLGKKYTPQTEAVYKAIANFLIQTLIDGYNGEGSKHQASNSHWYVSIITNSCQYNQNPWSTQDITIVKLQPWYNQIDSMSWIFSAYDNINKKTHQ